MTFFPDSKTFIQIGSFTIAWYAICIIIGAVIAYKIGQYNFKRMGLDKEVLSDYFFGLIPSIIKSGKCNDCKNFKLTGPPKAS